MPRLLRLLLSGGEPFLRDDLPEICALFHEDAKVSHITIPTNASMPRSIEEKTRAILESCRGAYVNVSLSLDALGEKRDGLVKKEGSFKSFRETYERLKDLKNDHDNLGVGVITTMNAKNQDDIIEIYEYAIRELRVDNFGFNVVRGKPKDPRIKEIDIARYKELTEMVIEDTRQGRSGRMNIPLFNLFLAKRDLLYDIYYRTYTQDRYLIPCYSGKIRGVMDERGNVFPCETYMYKAPELGFGNLRDFSYDFGALWDSRKAKGIRERISSTKCYCSHECDLTTNILFNPLLLPRLLKESVKYYL